jgi:hypothetical protein
MIHVTRLSHVTYTNGRIIVEKNSTDLKGIGHGQREITCNDIRRQGLSKSYETMKTAAISAEIQTGYSQI